MISESEFVMRRDRDGYFYDDELFHFKDYSPGWVASQLIQLICVSTAENNGIVNVKYLERLLYMFLSNRDTHLKELYQNENS